LCLSSFTIQVQNAQMMHDTLLPTPKYKIMYFLAVVIVLLFPYNVYCGVRANRTDMLISLHKCKEILSNNCVHQ